MTFPANTYMLAFAAGLLGTLASFPFWKAWCIHRQLVDDPGHRKIHDVTIPLAGGLAVFTGLAVSLIAGYFAIHFDVLPRSAIDAMSYGFSRRALQLGAILFGAAGMLVLGLIDDRYELKAGRKFLGQFLIAALVAAAGIRITLFIPNIAFSYFITILWILTVTNAFNFMDNMNGLCSGLAAIAACHFGLISAAAGQYLVALLSFLIAGAAFGFLPYNFPKAKAFLGDSGSHLLGFLMAVVAILPHFYTAKNPRTAAVLSPLFILAVPLGDLLSVVIWRWRSGKPFYIGDTNHLSHRLVRAGLNPMQAVVLIWVLGAAAGFLSWL